MKKFLVFGVISVLLASCEEYTSLAPSAELTFVQADRNFQFYRNAYPKGAQFELVAVAGGRKAVWVDNARASAVGGGMGGPVAMVSTNNKIGMMLDSNMCATGEMLGYSIGMTTIHQKDIYGVGERPNQDVCFTPT